MITIEEFCKRHCACREGRDCAIENCRDMQHAWDTLKPEWLTWVATRKGVLTDRELRLFAVWSARQVQHLMTDPRSIAALDVAERHANGQATDEELAAARDAAWDAAWDARDAAWAAAWDAWAAAWAAAWDARDAAWAAAWDARDAAWDAQAKWLRANTKPNFA